MVDNNPNNILTRKELEKLFGAKLSSARLVAEMMERWTILGNDFLIIHEEVPKEKVMGFDQIWGTNDTNYVYAGKYGVYFESAHLIIQLTACYPDKLTPDILNGSMTIKLDGDNLNYQIVNHPHGGLYSLRMHLDRRTHYKYPIAIPNMYGSLWGRRISTDMRTEHYDLVMRTFLESHAMLNFLDNIIRSEQTLNSSIYTKVPNWDVSHLDHIIISFLRPFGKFYFAKDTLCMINGNRIFISQNIGQSFELFHCRVYLTLLRFNFHGLLTKTEKKLVMNNQLTLTISKKFEKPTWFKDTCFYDLGTKYLDTITGGEQGVVYAYMWHHLGPLKYTIAQTFTEIQQPYYSLFEQIRRTNDYALSRETAEFYLRRRKEGWSMQSSMTIAKERNAQTTERLTLDFVYNTDFMNVFGL
jgi:hypothetical protein